MSKSVYNVFTMTKIYSNGRVYLGNVSSINKYPIDYRPKDGRNYWLVEVKINNDLLFERRFEKENEGRAFIEGFILSQDVPRK